MTLDTKTLLPNETLGSLSRHADGSHAMCVSVCRMLCPVSGRRVPAVQSCRPPPTAGLRSASKEQYHAFGRGNLLNTRARISNGCPYRFAWVGACPCPLDRVCPLDVDFLYNSLPAPLLTCRIPTTRVRVLALTFWLFAAGWQRGEGVWTSMVQARPCRRASARLCSAGHRPHLLCFA